MKSAFKMIAMLSIIVLGSCSDQLDEITPVEEFPQELIKTDGGDGDDDECKSGCQ